MHVRSILLGLVLFTVCNPSVHAQKLLRWKFRAGQTFDVELDQDVEMATSLMQNAKSSADMGMTLGWNVIGVDKNGEARIEQSIDRIRMKMIMPGNQQFEFDSAQEAPSDGMAKHLAESVTPLIGTRFSQQVSDRGEVNGMKLTAEAKEELESAMPATQVNEAFSHKGLESLIRQAALVLPAHPVKPGDTWEGESRIDSPAGALDLHTTYTYHGTEQIDGRPLERIDLDIRVGFGKGANALGLNVKVSEQQNTGVIYFDAERGQFVKSKIRQRMTMETELGEQVHRQQLNTQLAMTISERTTLASTERNVR